MTVNQRYRSARRRYLLRFRNGRSAPLDVITRLENDANRRGTSSASLKPSTQETEFVRFPDGAVADLVRDAAGNLCFVIARGGTVSFHQTLKIGDVKLVPPEANPSILAGVCKLATYVALCSWFSARCLGQ